MSLYFKTDKVTLWHGSICEQVKQIEDGSIDTIVTSPPYWKLRDYQSGSREIGQELSPGIYVEVISNLLVNCLWPKLKDTGVTWINVGDTYQNGQACLIPQRLAIALQDKGWIVRSYVIWERPNAMPENVRDRPSNCYETIIMATKTRSYYYDWEKIAEPILEESKARAARGVSLTTKYGQPCNTAQSVNSQNKPRSPRKFDTPEERDEAIAQGKLPGLSGLLRNKRNIWKIPIGGNHTPHPAPFPVDLPKTCILVSCPTGGTVLDPFAGSGTTLFAAKELGMHAIGIELNHEYCEIIAQRCGQLTISF